MSPSAEDPHVREAALKRLRQAVKRSEAVLSTRLAQDPLAPELGTLWHLTMQKNTTTGAMKVAALRRDTVDRLLLEQAATYARVFVLKKEPIYGPKVARAITYFAVTEQQKFLSEQLGRMWEEQPFPRTYMMKSDSGTPLTPPGGISDSSIGDRVLYSEIVHADDASSTLEHVSDEDREWALSSLVGDWIALVAHQQWLISSVRPDLCPAPTPWAGDHKTIFRRLGGRVDEEHESTTPTEQERGEDGVRPESSQAHRDDQVNPDGCN